MELRANPGRLDDVLRRGAERAAAETAHTMELVRERVGLTKGGGRV